MLIVGNDDKMIISTKNMLNSRFDMKDLGPINVIFGIKIIMDSCLVNHIILIIFLESLINTILELPKHR